MTHIQRKKKADRAECDLVEMDGEPDGESASALVCLVCAPERRQNDACQREKKRACLLCSNQETLLRGSEDTM